MPGGTAVLKLVVDEMWPVARGGRQEPCNGDAGHASLSLGSLPGWDNLKSATSQSQNKEQAAPTLILPQWVPRPAPHPSLGLAASCLSVCFAVLDLGLAGVLLAGPGLVISVSG